MDGTNEKKLKTSELFDYKNAVKDSKTSRKRSNSLSESTTSADESGNSVGDEISSSSLSGTSSPATSAHDYSSNTYDESDDYHPLKSYETNHNNNNNNNSMQTMVTRHPSMEWIDLMTLRYFQANGGNYPQHQQPPIFYPSTVPLHSSYESNTFKHSPQYMQTSSLDLMRSYEHVPQTDYPTIVAQAVLEQTKKTVAPIPPKKTGFSISAILGCES